MSMDNDDWRLFEAGSSEGFIGAGFGRSRLLGYTVMGATPVLCEGRKVIDYLIVFTYYCIA